MFVKGKWDLGDTLVLVLLIGLVSGGVFWYMNNSAELCNTDIGDIPCGMNYNQFIGHFGCEKSDVTRYSQPELTALENECSSQGKDIEYITIDNVWGGEGPGCTIICISDSDKEDYIRGIYEG